MYIFRFLIVATLFFIGNLFAKESVVVKITKDIPYLYVKHKGQRVKIQRVQDTSNILVDDYTKTSRECPPFCINPTKVDKNVKTIAEVELIHFIKEYVNKNRGVVVDARLKQWYELETIPSAINIPYTIFESNDKKIAKKVFMLLGMRVKSNGDWDFKDVKKLAIFCNGLWDQQSHHLIKGMLKFGFPADKILYYRSGFQGWKFLGLTTIIQKENQK